MGAALAATGLAGARPPADAVVRALTLAARARGVEGTPQPRLAPSRDLRTATRLFYAEVAGVPLTEAALNRTAAQLRRLSPRYRTGLTVMLDAMVAAQRLRNQAFTGVSASQIRHARVVALRAHESPASVSHADAISALEIVARIDMRAMFAAAMLLREAAGSAMGSFDAAGAPGTPVETAYDAIVIGTTGDDTYTRDKQLVIEPGGDDVYLNNAGGVLSSQAFATTGGCVSGGGATGKAPPNLECTPLPSQVCTYDTLGSATGVDGLPLVGVPNHDEPGMGRQRDGSCGNDARRRALAETTADITNDGDSRGVAVVLDRGGADTYTAPWSHDDPLFGLLEFCHPSDPSTTNTNRDYFQAGALAGISLLWDDGPGANTFRGRLNTQASGHVGGIAMLLSTGGDDDHYWADRLAQGNGIAGGVGVLVDTGGTNTFLLEPPVVYRNEFRPAGRECSQQGRAGQGQGGFGGVGVLWNEGTATYRAVVHETEAASPYEAILDASGSPALTAGSDAQGSGESFPLPNTPGGVVAGAGILYDAGSDASVCAGAGKLSGASHLSRSPGAVDRSCGTFNLAAEISATDLGTTLQHLGAGAVGIRVVTAR